MSRRANGEGSLYFDADRRRWVGQADAGINPKTGKRRRVKVTGKPGESKTSVGRRLRDQIADLDNANAPKTVGELVEKWMSKGMPGKRAKSASTIAGLRSYAENHVLPVFGNVELKAVTVDDIEDFLEARVETHAKSSIIKLKTVLAQSFDFAVARRYVRWNPARVAILPAGASQKREPRALLASERRALINVSSDHRLGAWVALTATMALRPGEGYGLCWDAVDLDRGILTIRRTLLRDRVLKESTKTGKVRTLAMPSETIDTLRKHRKRVNEERLLMGNTWPKKWADLVFVSENGTPLDEGNMRRHVARWAKQADIEGGVTPYDLRHTALTRLREMGASRDDLVDIAGHETTRMIDKHYVHRDQITVSAAADLWDRDAV
jgi:integrase